MGRRYHEVMRDLGDAIVGATYAEGTWLPNISALEATFGCGKGVMREALRGLEERGLVEVRQGRGVRVRQREEWDTRNSHVLRSCVERGPQPEILWWAIDARSAVECEAAARAIEQAADDDFGLLAGRIDAMERASAGAAHDDYVIAEVWFHRTFSLLSDNALLSKLVEPLHAVLAEVRRERAPDRDRAAIRHHRHILEAVSSRDADFAAQAILAYAERLSDWVGAPR
jgi:DNA-binding FadR family transcriptional regulator